MIIKNISSTSAHKQSCWKCGHTASKINIFCSRPECGVIQAIDAAKCNYFDLLRVSERFDVNLDELEKSFKSMQKLLHPDKFSTNSVEEKEISNNCSSLVNQAYQTLRSPVDRVAYLLLTRGVNVLTEGGTMKKTDADPNLMLEIFSMREKIDELGDDHVRLADLLKELQKSVVLVRNQLQDCLDKNDIDALTREAVRFKYLSKTLEEVQRKVEEKQN